MNGRELDLDKYEFGEIIAKKNKMLDLQNDYFNRLINEII